MLFEYTININQLIFILFCFSLSTFASYYIRECSLVFKVLPFIVLWCLFIVIGDSKDPLVLLSVFAGMVYIFREHIFRILFFIKGVLINMLYYLIFFLKNLYIIISNAFTWIYNFICKIFKINYRFYYFHEEVQKKEKRSSYKKKTYKKPQNKSYKKRNSYNSKSKSNNNYRNRNVEEDLKRAKEEIKKAREQARKAEEELKSQKQNQGQRQTKTDNRTPWEILGVSKSVTRSELTKIFYKKSLKCHPDKVQTLSDHLKNEAHQEFIKLNEAYNKLKSIVK